MNSLGPLHDPKRISTIRRRWLYAGQDPIYNPLDTLYHSPISCRTASSSAKSASGFREVSSSARPDDGFCAWSCPSASAMRASRSSPSSTGSGRAAGGLDGWFDESWFSASAINASRSSASGSSLLGMIGTVRLIVRGVASYKSSSSGTSLPSASGVAGLPACVVPSAADVVVSGAPSAGTSAFSSSSAASPFAFGRPSFIHSLLCDVSLFLCPAFSTIASASRNFAFGNRSSSQSW